MIQRSSESLLEILTYIGAASGFFFLWTVFEKEIVEPYNLNAYMPFYRVDGICIWDIMAIAIIALVFRFLVERRRRNRA